jgi:hypothetical protein
MTARDQSMPDTLADLAELLAGQLTAAAADLRAGNLTAWQCCGIAADLGDAQRVVARLRRRAGRYDGEDG